jgi:hypothetical protein
LKKKEEVETCWFGSAKMVLTMHYAEAGERHLQSLTPAALGWLNSLIGSGGLLLLVSDLFAI